MFNRIYVAAALLMPTSVFAAEVVSSSPQFSWGEIIGSIIAAVFSIVVVPYINNLKEQAKTQQALNTVNLQDSLLSQKEKVITTLKWFLAEHALSIAATEFPRLAKDIAVGKFKEVGSVKAELYKWGDRLKLEAIEFFKSQDVNLLAVVGEKALDQLIDAAAARVSPFPGKDVAVELLEHKVAPMLIHYGVDWVRKYYSGEHSEHEVTAAQATNILPADKAA